MRSIVEVVLPFFALVGVGYFAARRQLIAAHGVQGLATFVYWFAIPVLLFRGVATRRFEELADWRIMIVWGMATLLVFLAARAIARRALQVGREHAIWHGFGAAQANNGFLAIPLMPALFGEQAIAPVALTMLADMLVLYPVAFVMADLASSRPHSAAERAATIARTFYTNPYLIAILAGLVVSAFTIDLPAPVMAFATLLGQAGSPTALFALGASLAIHTAGSGQIGAIAMMNAGKLIACPLLVAAIGLWIVPLSPLQYTVAVATAALPTGINLFLISQRYVANVGIYSAAILSSTVIAVATFSIVVWVLGT